MFMRSPKRYLTTVQSLTKPTTTRRMPVPSRLVEDRPLSRSGIGPRPSRGATRRMPVPSRLVEDRHSSRRGIGPRPLQGAVHRDRRERCPIRSDNASTLSQDVARVYLEFVDPSPAPSRALSGPLCDQSSSSIVCIHL